MRCWRTLGQALAFATLVVTALPAAAQEAPASSILTVDQDRLFAESAFGKAVVARETAAARALEAENAAIEARLVAEEQDLTTKRETLSATEFAALADAFDARVVRIRLEQDAKARNLSRTRDSDRKAFFRAAFPVLSDLLVERNAVAIIDKAAILLSLSAIDVTDAAVAKVDAALGTGIEAGKLVPEVEPEAVPEKTPDLAPEPTIAPTPPPPTP
jgi:Skp family chaperone for outer membrane proteins